MSGKIGMRIFSMLLAMLLVSVGVVPAMAMDGKTSETANLDIVDPAMLKERTPSFINELRSKGCSEEEIAEAIVNLPRVSYISGWTEEDNKRISPLLQQGREGINYSMHGEANIMAENRDSGEDLIPSGMFLFDTVFSGVNGRVYPGPMECSSGGTKYQYLTTHLGKKIGSTDNWIEIGVETVYWNPGHYYIFTYDNNDVGNEWVTHYDLTDGSRDYNFEIYVSDVEYQEGYPYMISWEGQVVRTGFVPFAEGDLNEVHEYIRDDPGSFSDVSTSYVWDSYVYYNGYGVWWNEQLDAQLANPTYLAQNETEGVYGDFYKPWWSNAYRIDTWIT
ncbi:hypothetical protein [Methanoculleus sp.]|uniref:hypothetical protein n=2 Tax=unclassified Methanoculleus TaxID=2619537 RepID=UPI00272EE052|nr:hypothetical protein [Methanoculleus sp.]